MLNRKDPLVDSVKQVMEENAIRAEVEAFVNEQYGITSRKALPYELQEDYDADLEMALNEIIGESHSRFQAIQASRFHDHAGSDRERHPEDYERKYRASYIKQGMSKKAAAEKASDTNSRRIDQHYKAQKTAEKMAGIDEGLKGQKYKGSGTGSSIFDPSKGGYHVVDKSGKTVGASNKEDDAHRMAKRYGEGHKVVAAKDFVKEEQLNELSSGTLKSYIQKAYHTAGETQKAAEKSESKRKKYHGKKNEAIGAVKAGVYTTKHRKNKVAYTKAKHSEWEDRSKKDMNKLRNRSVGVYRALQRLKENNLNEISDKIHEEIRTNLINSIYESYLDGQDSFNETVDNLTEEQMEILTLNELSKNTLRNYKDASAASWAYADGNLDDDEHYRTIGHKMTDVYGRPKWKERSKEKQNDDIQTVRKRLKGLSMVHAKLSRK